MIEPKARTRFQIYQKASCRNSGGKPLHVPIMLSIGLFLSADGNLQTFHYIERFPVELLIRTRSANWVDNHLGLGQRNLCKNRIGNHADI